MSITPLFKMTLYGAETQKTSVLEQLQESGCAHLTSLGRSVSDQVEKDVSAATHEALKYLRNCPQQLRQLRRRDRFDCQAVVDEVLTLKGEQRELSDERDDLRQAIENVEAWGEFQLPPDCRIGDIRMWFYVVPLHELEKSDNWSVPYQVVARDPRNAYVVVLSNDEPTGISGSPVELDSRPLSKLRTRLEEVEERLEEVHYLRTGLTRWCDLLEAELDASDDAAQREQAIRQLLSTDRVFALQGWIPQREEQQMRRFARQHQLAIALNPPADDDEPPTLLDNPERLTGSEALVTFYKTPQYGSWDPSVISLVSFAVFFAMIVADAGYGLVLAITMAFLWRMLGNTQEGRRARFVLATSVGCTIAYGILCGSYFGISPPPDLMLGRLRILDAQSQAQMMPLSIVIGVIHLSLAHLMMAWIHRGRATALSSLGWVSVMAGATLAGISLFGEGTHQLWHAGEILLIAGLIAVVLFSSTRPLFSSSIKNHLLRVLDGVRGLTNLSGLFGDALSYLRLFALGLASAKLSETFNNLGASAWDAAGFGVIAALGILVLGHTLNLALSLMSGMVHGLRLNCIEFYKWGLPDEGYLFEPFAKKAKNHER